jgi:hypothetical protein
MESAVAGAEAVSRLRAGRVWRGRRGSSVVFAELPREYATDGALVVNRDGGWGDQRCCGSPKPVSVS